MPRGRAAYSSRLVRAKPGATWGYALGGAFVLSITACGQPNPRILKSEEAARGGVAPQLDSVGQTEPEKIRALIKEVRGSEHTFVFDGIDRKGPAAADKLQLLLDRDPAGVRTAEEFITRIATPDRAPAAPDRVITGPDDEDQISARQWLLVKLAEIEGKPRPNPAEAAAMVAVASDTAGSPAPTESVGEVKIFDALMIVERSGLTFVSPPRKPVPSVLPKSKDKPPAIAKRKPKRKEYTSREFADMLRKKWEFLGADIDDLPTFMDEIGSESFASMTPYLVVLEDGTEQEFRPWLEAEVAKQKTVAQGGAP